MAMVKVSVICSMVQPKRAVQRLAEDAPGVHRAERDLQDHGGKGNSPTLVHSKILSAASSTQMGERVPSLINAEAGGIVQTNVQNVGNKDEYPDL